MLMLQSLAFSVLYVSYREIVLSYNTWYAELGDLADSVRPGGHLANTVAELAIYVINDYKRGAVKRILPLRFAVCWGGVRYSWGSLF